MIAGLFSLLAAAFLFAPLWRARRADGRWSVGGLIATLVSIPAAWLIYTQVTTFTETAESGASGDELAMVRQLAERLETNPEDANGWQLLGRSYMTIGEYARARNAFMQAWQRTSMPSAQLKLGLGEAMIWTEPSTARGEAGDLIEDVLAVEPMNQRALWWGGLVAAERGQPENARSRWQSLLETNPPPEVAELLRQQLSLLPAQTASAAASPSSAATEGPVLTLNVSVADSMPLDRLGPNSYVFVFARAPGGGPPIAGMRLDPQSLPGTFTLSDANAIIAGRSLSAFEALTIVARISVNGDPIEQPGDLVAEATYRAGEDPTLSLTIDQIVGGG